MFSYFLPLDFAHNCFQLCEITLFKEVGLCFNWSGCCFATIHFQSELNLLSQKVAL